MINSHLLYQLSYAGLVPWISASTGKK